MRAPYYSRNGITIYHGDCLEILPELASVDHVITDPPYSRDVYVRLSMPNTKTGSETPGRLLGESLELNNGGRMGQLAAGAIGAVDDLRDPVAREVARLAKRWVLVFTDVEGVSAWIAALTCASSLRYVRTGAWVKPDSMPQMTGDRPAVGFEACVIAHAAGPMKWNGKGNRAVWTYNTAKGAERPDHPCPKPIGLMRDLIRQFTDEGELILDPFMGSGTTLRAAKDMGRRAIGIEIEERWCEVAARRLDQEMLSLQFEPAEPRATPPQSLTLWGTEGAPCQ